MKKANLPREAALLLLAPAAFGGAALWTQQKAPAAAQSGPFQLVVKDVQRQKPTARDVAEGFDSRFVVSLGHKGAQPAGWGEDSTGIQPGNSQWLSLSGQQWRPLGTPSYEKRSSIRLLSFDDSTDSYKLTVAARLADAPEKLGALRLELVNFGADKYVATPEAPQAPNISVIPASSLAFDVRQAGEKIAAPHQASRFAPLSLKEVRVEAPSKKEDYYRVEASFYASGATQAHSFFLHTLRTTYCQDESGKRYPMSVSSTTAHNNWNVEWWLNSSRLSPKARKLTFHGRVSLDEYWPTAVQAVLWDKTAQKPQK